MSNSYKNKTEFYGIPVIGKDQRLSEQEELKKFNIIENQLLAATKGVMCCVYEEGCYHLVDNIDGTYTVMLMSTGQNVALEGVVRGGYCYSKDPILWEVLRKGRVYHLYVAYTDKLYQDEYAFAVTSAEIPWAKDLMNYLYLAKVDLTQNEPILDTNPDGKIYSNDIACHVSDKINPHGEEVMQDSLIIKKLVLQKDDGSNVVLLNSSGGGVLNGLIGEREIDRSVMEIHIPSNKGLKKVMHETNFELVSGGKNGIDFNVPGCHEVVSVNVSEKVSGVLPSFKLGQVAVDYGRSNLVKIYNSGDEGISMSVIVRYK